MLPLVGPLIAVLERRTRFNHGRGADSLYARPPCRTVGPANCRPEFLALASDSWVVAVGRVVIPEKTAASQVAFFLPKAERDDAQARMRRRNDSDDGRTITTRRFATVEPVFGDLRHNKRPDRFSLRGRQKVDGQWRLYS